jgi:hypothetical protein
LEYLPSSVLPGDYCGELGLCYLRENSAPSAVKGKTKDQRKDWEKGRVGEEVIWGLSDGKSQ